MHRQQGELIKHVYFSESKLARVGEKKNAYRILVGKPERRRTLGRSRRRWVDNIKIDLREIGWGGMDWVLIWLRKGTNGWLL
jgi:hypothetical protein